MGLAKCKISMLFERKISVGCSSSDANHIQWKLWDQEILNECKNECNFIAQNYNLILSIN